MKDIILKNNDDVNVPFKHTAGSIKQAAGSTVAQHAKNLAARPLLESKSTATRGMQRLGGKVRDTGSTMAKKTLERARTANVLGMIRQTEQRKLKSGKLKTVNIFTTFRRAKRVDKDGKPLPKWMHPGVKGRRISLRALRRAIPKVIGHISGGNV
jgi:hypothetical protein